MHLLLILHRDDKIVTPEQVDKFISAEIPNHREDPLLYEIVNRNMIHDPCGMENPNAHCMHTKTGQCRWRYPKDYQEMTSLRENESPLYRRRTVDFGDFHIYRKDKNGDRLIRDNCHVAPYNPWLLKCYNCHINTEFVGGVKAVKYLYKYIFKGHDIEQIKIVSDEKSIIYDECERHIEGRYVSAYEACWRIFEYELQHRSHKVQWLDIHLPGHHQLDNLLEDLIDIGQKGSTLEAWFRLNKSLKEKHQAILIQADRPSLKTDDNNQLTDPIEWHYYWQMPEFYTWDGKNSKWNHQKRKTLRIGRMYHASPTQPDLYHLRLLLFHVKAATCYEDLKSF